MSKCGTRIGWKALYAVALTSVRTTRDGNPINLFLIKYYKENLNRKSKKVGLVAIMHKLIKCIFSVLKNQKEYELRDHQIHSRMYLNNQTKTAA
jgi:hypothetical protein